MICLLCRFGEDQLILDTLCSINNKISYCPKVLASFVRLLLRFVVINDFEN